MRIGEMSGLGASSFMFLSCSALNSRFPLASGERLAAFLGKISVACTDLPSGSCPLARRIDMGLSDRKTAVLRLRRCQELLTATIR